MESPLVIDFLLEIESEEEVERRFGTERACQEALAAWRWPGGFRCGDCGGGSAEYLASRRTWYCRGCGRQSSVTAGSVFAHTKKPLSLWFRALWIFLHHPGFRPGAGVSSAPMGPMSVQLFMDRLGLKRYQTAWTWMQKLREWAAHLELGGPLGKDFQEAVQRAMKAVGTRGCRAWGNSRSVHPKNKWHQRHLARLRRATRQPRRHPAWARISDWLEKLRRPPVSRKHFGRWLAEGILQCWREAGADLPTLPSLVPGPLPYWRIIFRIHPTMRLQAS